MIEHRDGVHPSGDRLTKKEQLAWKIAELAAGRPPIDPEAAEMARCRIVDNAAVALASLNRQPVVSARAQARSHPRPRGGTLFGIGTIERVHCQWAAWANAVAARELDFHDTFLAVEFGHPGDNIAPLIAVAQQCGSSGEDLLRGIMAAYEVHVALMKGINLHQTVALWQKIRTVEDPKWEQDYHHPDPSMRAFGGRLEIVMDGGKVITAEKAVANAHPNGITPWTWPDYLDKFDRLTDGVITEAERNRFIALVEHLDGAENDALSGLNPEVKEGVLEADRPTGIFDFEK